MMWAHDVDHETMEDVREWGEHVEQQMPITVVEPFEVEDTFAPAGAFEDLLASDVPPPALDFELPVLTPAVLAFGLASGVVYAWWRHSINRQHRRTWLPIQTRTWLGLWPGPGFAGWRTLHREYGRGRPRKIAKHIRPSLSWRDRWLGDPRAYSVEHGKAHRAWGGVIRHTVRTSFQDNTLVAAPAQEGKSALAVGYIWDAPGPVLVTTIRADLLEASGGYRGTLGDLHVWNPAAVGTIGSTFHWNLIPGCENYETAVRRANAIVYASAATGLSDASFWQDQAAMALGAYMHAAALVSATPEQAAKLESGADLEYVDAPITMQTVRDWLDSTDLEPYAILQSHPGAARNAALTLLGLFQAPANTRGSIITTLRRALRFLADDAIVEALTPHPTKPSFDIAEFLRSRDSLYLMSPPADSQSPVAPLMAAFVSELFHEAMLANSRQRLDPHLTMVLDEIANVCPVPLDAWLSYAAGSGVQIHAFGQSWAQFEARWGREASSQIWNNSKCKILWPTNDDPSTYDQLVALGGPVRIDRKDRMPDGTKVWRTSDRDSMALSDPGTQVPNGYVVCRLRGKRPVLMQARQYWKDKRSKIGLPHLPPVEARYVPDAMPELRQKVREEFLPPAESLSASDTSPSGRRPEGAPERRRGASTPEPAPERRPSRSLARGWNPASDEADEDLGL